MLRQEAVDQFSNGKSANAICTTLKCSRSWFYKWLNRSKSGDQQWYKCESREPKNSPNKISSNIENTICLLHNSLDKKDLFCGAQSIFWEMNDLEINDIPSVRTIDRVLARKGLIRQKQKYKTKGQKYPYFEAKKPNQIHQVDFVGPCYLSGPIRFYSLNVMDLATRRCAIQPVLSKGSQDMLDALWAIWHRIGIPDILQIDNEMVFYGSQRYPRAMGPIIRLCLTNGSTPLFIPQREPWRNGVVEKFNDHYQQKFLTRKTMFNYEELLQGSLEFEQKYNNIFRLSFLNGKTPLTTFKNMNAKLIFPADKIAPRHRIEKPEKGFYHLVRLIRSNKILNIFGETFKMPDSLIYEYAMATIDVKEQKLLVYNSNKKLIKNYDYKSR